MQYKNIPKIKVLRMTCQFIMIFSGIFEDLLCKNYRGRSCHLAKRVVGTPPASWAHGGPPPLILAPILFFFPQTRKTNSSPSPSSFCCHFRSPCSKHLSQNCLGEIVPWYVTPPLVQLVFVLVLYSLKFFATQVTLFLSLHVKFIWFQVVLMLDIGSRHF